MSKPRSNLAKLAESELARLESDNKLLHGMLWLILSQRGFCAVVTQEEIDRYDSAIGQIAAVKWKPLPEGGIMITAETGSPAKPQ